MMRVVCGAGELGAVGVYCGRWAGLGWRARSEFGRRCGVWVVAALGFFKDLMGVCSPGKSGEFFCPGLA